MPLHRLSYIKIDQAGKTDDGKGFLCQGAFRAPTNPEPTSPFALAPEVSRELPTASKCIKVNNKYGLVAAGCFDGSLVLADELELTPIASTTSTETIHSVDFSDSLVTTAEQKGRLRLRSL